MRIVRLANFVLPQSGGLRVALRELGAGYLAAGHTPTLVLPGERPGEEDTRQGRVITVPGLPMPGTGGYRVIVDRAAVCRQLEALQPDRLEVSDRTTLRWTGGWARACSPGVRATCSPQASELARRLGWLRCLLWRDAAVARNGRLAVRTPRRLRPHSRVARGEATRNAADGAPPDRSHPGLRHPFRAAT